MISLLNGNALSIPLADNSVQCIVTSPPYFGLRDYQVKNQIGLEATPALYVAHIVAVMRECWRVLKDDGTLWLNLGDSYSGNGSKQTGRNDENDIDLQRRFEKFGTGRPKAKMKLNNRTSAGRSDVKPKDLCGIPWRVAFALQQPFYSGRIKNEQDRIWLAAMIDTEGCMFIHKRKAGQHNGQGYDRKHDSFSAGLEVANTHLSIIERCQAITGIGSICHQDKESRLKNRNLRLYRWNVRSNECRNIVREVYPYLVAKKQEARLLLGCPSSGEQAERAHVGLMALHNGQEADIDFPEPASMYEAGWYLRSDIIWSKSNPMPESVTDRPTKSHEYVFLLTKQARYYYDAEAIQEKAATGWNGSSFTDERDQLTKPNLGMKPRGGGFSRKTAEAQLNHGAMKLERPLDNGFRNRRDVWTVSTLSYSGAHFATFPPKLVEPMILAGSRRGDVVLDPFSGSGTVGAVCAKHGRNFVGVELNPKYIELAHERTSNIQMELA